MATELEPSDAVLLRGAVNALQARLRAQGSGGGVGPTALVVLGRLLRAGVLSAGELAELEGLQPQSLTRALKSLEEAGLIDRGIDEADHRRSTIAITAAGEVLLRDMLRKQIGWLARAIENGLTPSERETLRAAAGLLERIAKGEPAPAPVSDRVLNLVPSFYVSDVERTLRFYEKLDFVQDGRWEDGGRLVWASMHGRVQRAARIMFSRADDPVEPSRGMTFYCWTRDIVSLHARLTADGLGPGPIVNPENLVDGEFRLSDPDGYAIAVGQLRAEG
jgi:DNA-binding MarR family transcriptional regulator/catechol 2,3-dioxygenase-like lactoylglutathione lyase family enzyme